MRVFNFFLRDTNPSKLSSWQKAGSIFSDPIRMKTKRLCIYLKHSIEQDILTRNLVEVSKTGNMELAGEKKAKTKF